MAGPAAIIPAAAGTVLPGRRRALSVHELLPRFPAGPAAPAAVAGGAEARAHVGVAPISTAVPNSAAHLNAAAASGAALAFGSGLQNFIQREYYGLLATVPALALGSLAVFALRDRARASTAGDAVGDEANAAPALQPEEEWALAGIVLALMADRIEYDPAACPLLACAAAHLVSAAWTAGGRGAGPWTGLTERARRAAVEVIRPAALDALSRALNSSTPAAAAARLSAQGA
jgi:hypothetical protein